MACYLTVRSYDTLVIVMVALVIPISTTQTAAIGKPLIAYKAEELLRGKQEQVVDLSFAPTSTKYQVIHDSYREQGQQHELFFITNVHGLLRKHEREAWQNLIRVLSHEINNSLAPIASLADTLNTQAKKQNLPEIYSDNLAIMSGRAKGLRDFINSYRQLSFLPPPQKQWVNVAELFNKIQPLFPICQFSINQLYGESIWADPVQLEKC